LLKGFGLNKSDLLAKLEAAFAKKPTVEGGQEPFLSNNLNAVFQEAERIAQKMKDQFIAQEHIFLALFNQKETLISEELRRHGITLKNIENIITEIRGGQKVNDMNAE